MTVLALVIGVLLGAAVADEGVAGALLGGVVGWLFATTLRMRREVGVLGERLRDLEAVRSAAQSHAIAPVGSAADADHVATAPLPEPARTAAAGVASQLHADAHGRDPSPAPAPRVQRSAPARNVEPPQSPPTASSDPWALAGRWIRRWFTEGNLPVKVGMLLLFVGVGALLKYAAEQGLFALPIELRLAAVALAGVAALAFGFRHRVARPGFALALQGGALGVLLLTVFAAYQVWQVLPAGAAFALVLLLVAGSAALALLQQSLALAVLGTVGGFLAPVLISTGSGNHVALFSYYALLNAAVFAIAWVRPWRVLNLVGFGFTFGIGTLWGWRYYRPELFGSVEPFLILFFLFYVAIAVLYAERQPRARRGLVDGSLVFGTPLLAFPLQAALLDGESMPLAWSALAIAVLYAVLAARLLPRDGLRTLGLSFAALAVGFASLAVPLALSAQWTASTWALEGAALLWLGLRQQQRLAVIAGVVLQALAGLAWLLALDDMGFGAQSIEPLMLLNGRFLGGLLLAAAALFSAWQLQRHGGWPRAAWLGLIVGLGWWTLAGLDELRRFDDYHGALLGWLAVTLLLLALLRRGIGWWRLGWPMLAGFGGTAFLALVEVDLAGPPLQQLGSITWPLLLLAGLFALSAMREPEARGLSLAHVSWLSTLALVAGLELQYRAALATGPAWSMVALVLPLLLLAWASLRRSDWLAFPLADRFDRYRQRWWVPATAALALWWVASLSAAGDPAPLPYMPLLNPLELVQVGLLLVLLPILRELLRDDRRTLLLGAVAGWLTISAATLRAVHHLGGVGWDDLLWRSMLAQTSLTVVWSVLGVAAWVRGSRRGSHPVWLAGALLMGLVLAKLVLIDRGYMGNIAGIVSFLAVGLLLTMVGYLAPSPPRTARAQVAS